MPTFKELSDRVTLSEQLQANEDGSIVLINIFTVDPADEDELLVTWERDAHFMKAQPGYISTQLHKAIGGSPTFINYAIWESVESFRNAFTNPEFQKHIANYPESTIVSPHLFKKLAVKGHCVE